MLYGKLRQKEVINAASGSTMGYVSDLVIDEATGRIAALIVPGCDGLRSLFRQQPTAIDWGDIIKIGEDVILVSGSIMRSGR